MSSRNFGFLGATFGLALLVVASVGAQAQQLDPTLAKGSLAVLDFKNKLAAADSAAIDSGYFADISRSAALKVLPGLKVITRENILVLIQATGQDLADCEGECEVETGRRIGADLVISGDLLRIGSSFKLNLRLHETRNGQLLNGEVASGKTVDELDANTIEAVHKLLGPILQSGEPKRGPDAVEHAPLAAVPPEAVETRMATGRKVGIGVIGAALAAGVGATVFAIKGHELTSQIQSGGLASGNDIQSKENAAKATNGPAIGLTIGAGAALVAGIALIVFNPSSSTTSDNGSLVAVRF